MAHHARLHIFDASDSIFETIKSAHNVAVQGGVYGLKKELEKLLFAGDTCEEIIFSCHGSPGQLKFGTQSWTYMDRLDSSGRFSRLFRGFGKIYFQSCNVAAGSDGDQFLKMVGTDFFRTAGGLSAGWTVTVLANDGLLSTILGAATSNGLFAKLRGKALPLVVPFVNGPRFKVALSVPGGMTVELYEFNP